jgi:hypothetical protein
MNLRSPLEPQHVSLTLVLLPPAANSGEAAPPGCAPGAQPGTARVEIGEVFLSQSGGTWQLQNLGGRLDAWRNREMRMLRWVGQGGGRLAVEIDLLPEEGAAAPAAPGPAGVPSQLKHAGSDAAAAAAAGGSRGTASRHNGGSGGDGVRSPVSSPRAPRPAKLLPTEIKREPSLQRQPSLQLPSSPHAQPLSRQPSLTGSNPAAAPPVPQPAGSTPLPTAAADLPFRIRTFQHLLKLPEARFGALAAPARAAGDGGLTVWVKTVLDGAPGGLPPAGVRATLVEGQQPAGSGAQPCLV